MAYSATLLDKRLKQLDAQIDANARKKSNAPTLTTQQFAEEYGNFKHTTPAFHVPWYEALDDPTQQRLLLLGPREHAKTSVVLTYVKKRIVEDRNIRIGVLSQAGPLARSFMRFVKRSLETDLRLQRDYGGPFVGKETWNSTEITVAGSNQTKEVTLFTLGSGSQVTGRHTDLLIFDDVESTKTVKTEDRRKSTKQWFAAEAVPTLDPDGKAIVIGSRKHFDDLYSSLMLPGSGWTYLDNALSVYDTAGEPIWIEKWSKDALARRKMELDATDIRAWPQEYENRPISADTQMFMPNDWPKYTESPAWFLDHRDRFKIHQGWDTAISDRTKADYTACVTFAVDANKNVYVLSVVRGQWTIAQVQLQLEKQYSIWQPDSIAIEESGFHSPIVRSMIAATHVPARGIKPPGDKVTHARYLEARAAAGTVHVPKIPVPWWGDYARELTEFPSGAHDDMVDASGYALDIALPLSGWDGFFSDQIASINGVPQVAPVSTETEQQAATTPFDIEEVCTLCTAALGSQKHSNTLIRGYFCSRQCLAFAERLPHFKLEAA